MAQPSSSPLERNAVRMLFASILSAMLFSLGIYILVASYSVYVAPIPPPMLFDWIGIPLDAIIVFFFLFLGTVVLKWGFRPAVDAAS